MSVVVFTGFMWLRIGTNAGYFEHDNEPVGSIKLAKFLNDYSNSSFWRKAWLNGVG
jgi:hypothetical protein